MKFSYYKKLRQVITLYLSFCIIIGCILNNSVVKASDWGIIDYPNDKIEFRNNSITWPEIHHVGDDNYTRYYTYKFEVSNIPYDLNTPFYIGGNATIDHQQLTVTQKESWNSGDTKEVIYTVNRNELMLIADKLGVTPEDVANGTGQLYLNPVYQTYKGDYSEESILDDWVFGLTAMKAAANWSSATLSNLPNYYNIKLDLSIQNLYNVQTKSVDKDGHSLTGAKDRNGNTTGDEFYTNKLYYQYDYNYELDAARKTLTKDNSTYNFAYWYYTFDKRGDNQSSVTKSTNYNTTPVSFPGPDAEDGSTLILYLVYEPAKPTTYFAKTVAEKPDGTVLMDIKTRADVNAGYVYQYSILSPKTMNGGKVYTYQNSCYLTYIKPDGTPESIPNIAIGNQINYPMPAAKEGSDAIFHVVYDTGPAIPTPIPSETPTPTLPPEIPPASDSASMPFTTIENTGVIRADLRGSERFVATQGVPTTESLYGQVTARKYLLGYNFVKKVGIENFTVKVTKNYILKWYSATPSSAGGSKLITETVPITQVITVPRAYGYWEIDNLECYQISNAVLNNYALPGGSITIYPNLSRYSPPSISVIHSDDPKDHILAPNEAVNGISLPAEIITPPAGKETTKPSIPKEDFTYIALSQTGKASVKSDYLSFNGSIVMSNVITEREAPNINVSSIPQCYDNIDNTVLYQPDNRIEATKLNGIFPSSGTITYSSIVKISSDKSDYLQYPISGLNNVVIHTPVVCIPSIIADNDRYVQLINPDRNSVQLVLDPDTSLSDFTVHISNTGFHSGIQGYFTRDFSRSLYDSAVSYIAKDKGLLMNQVKFPFDVYMDTGTLNNSTDDQFIKAETWISIDRNTPRFYLPMTVNEGIYTVNFRTVAVNGLPFLTSTETYANTQLYNYVATNKLNVEVSGRIYGLKIYDLSDYPIWEDVFRVTNSLDLKKDSTKYTDGTAIPFYSSGRYYTYSLGTNDQYGNETGRNIKYTFPLVNCSHPQYKNIGILKTGYVVRFSLETTGSMFSDACKISIKPNFYYVDKDGKNRKAVDLYYTESINNKTMHLVKVGSAQDQINLKEVMTGDIYQGIPEWELKQTAALRGMKYGEFIAKYSAMFNFSDIRLNWAFRTYVNNTYLNRIKSYASYSDVSSANIQEGDILERMQRWYGQYYIPNEVHIVAKDYDVMDYADKYGVDYDEGFWLKYGYIIVNFTIETVGDDGSRRLSYINYPNYRDYGNCSMWMLENPLLMKESYNGPTFNFYAGDFIIYYSDQRMTDDYDTEAIY